MTRTPEITHKIMSAVKSKNTGPSELMSYLVVPSSKVTIKSITGFNAGSNPACDIFPAIFKQVH
jgi:hypothetical protein